MSEEAVSKLIYAAVMCTWQCGCMIAICLLWEQVAKAKTPEEELSESLSAALKRGRPLTAEEYLRRRK